MFSLTKEIQCYVPCITASGFSPLIGIQILLALLLFILYLKARRPYIRISSFIFAQLFMLSTIGTVISSMQCSHMVTIEIYIAYTVLSTLILMLLPKVYHRILIRRHRAQLITEIMDWPQVFVNSLIEEVKVYYYDYAVPRAFASGKGIFLSIGMLELMDNLELKAILAHEVWHLRNNNKTQLLKQLSIMTFTKNRSKDELETLADTFAGEIVSKDALDSARAKINDIEPMPH